MSELSRQPNVLVFLTDDHAQWAIRAYGCRELVTPSMDHLAHTGVRFANAYTPTPVCSPGRASFWTGTIPSWHGVHDYVSNPDHPGIAEQPTLAAALKRAGYRTALIGKWHCHSSHDNPPQPHFDRWFSNVGTNARFGAQPFYDQDRRIEFHGHQAPLITDAAVDFLRGAQAEGQPWFCCVGYSETHSPLATVPERLVEPYRHADFDAVPDETLPACHGEPRAALSRNDREQIAQYYASVQWIDEQVGRLLDELDSLEARGNTLVIYTSDHGHNTGRHGIAYKGNSTTPQNLLEESIRVPLLASGPGVASGRVVEEPVDHCDTFQAILDWAGATPLDDAPRPGRSWRALVGDQPARDWRTMQICEYGNARMISDGRYKLIRRYPGPAGRWPDQLFDLEADPRETRNVIDEHANDPAIAMLDRALGAHFEQYAHPERHGLNLEALPRPNERIAWGTGEYAPV